jgi:hypothetical protein
MSLSRDMAHTILALIRRETKDERKLYLPDFLSVPLPSRSGVGRVCCPVWGFRRETAPLMPVWDDSTD